MKKINKKLLVALLALSIVPTATAVTMTGCGKKSDNSSVESSEDLGELNLDKTVLSIEEFKETYLSVEKKNIDDEVVWSSSDPTVLTVGQDGKVTALKAGKATVTVTAGDKTASCEVTVTATAIEPTLTVDKSTVGLMEEESVTVTPTVFWEETDMTEQAVIEVSVEDDTVATVQKNENGSFTVNAIKKGTTSVLVEAQLRGKEAYTQITVNVTKQDLVLDITNTEYEKSSEGYAVSIYTVESEPGDGKNTTAPTVTGLYKGQEVSDYTITWATEDNETVEVNATTGAITAKKAGTALVIGTCEYAVTEETYTVKILVTVQKPEVELENGFIALNRNDVYEINVAENETTATVKVNGTAVNYAYQASGNKFELGQETFAGIENKNVLAEVEVETETTVYKFKADVVDFAIGTKEEFHGWYDDYIHTCEKGKRVVLTADIDFGGETIKNAITGYWYDPNKEGSKNLWFNGTFDGQGHVLSNYSAALSLIPATTIDGVVKNVSLIGCKVTGNYGILGVDSRGTYENIFIEGELSATGDSGAVVSNALGGNGNNAKVKNVVIYAHDVSDAHTEAYGVSKNYNKANTFENFVVMVDVSNGYIGNDDKNGPVSSQEGLKFFTSFNAMKEGITELPEEFDKEVWTTYNGLIITKASKAYYDGLYEGTTMTVTNGETLQEGIHIGEVATVVVDKPNAIVTVEGLEENEYTLDGTSITLSSNVALNKTFTIHITATSSDGMCVYTKSVTSKTLEVVVVTTLAQQETALNKTEMVVATELANATDIALYVNGAKVTVVPTFADGKFTFAVSAFTGAGLQDTKIEARVNGVLNVVNFKTLVYNKFISTADDLYTIFKTTDGNDTSLYALENDIDMTGKSIGWGEYKYGFTLEGHGHVVNNFTCANGLLWKTTTTFVMKNIAFTNYVKTIATYSFLGYQLQGSLENVYIEGKQNGVDNTNPAYSFMNFVQGPVTNVIVNVHDRQCGAELGIYRDAPSKLTNFYIITNSYDGTSGKANAYGTIEEMKADVTELPEGFDTEFWTMYEGAILPKSVKAYYDTLTITVTGETAIQTGMRIGETNTIAVDKANAKVTVEGLDATEYTIEGNKITLTNTATPDKAFTVKISVTTGDGAYTYTKTVSSKVLRAIQEVTLQDGMIAINRNGNYEITTGEGETEATVKLNGVASNEKLKVANGKLTLTADMFKNVTDKTQKVQVEVASETSIYKFAVEVVDFALGTKAEFMAWSAGYKDTYNGNKYVVLTADIDFEGADLGNAITGWWYLSGVGNLRFNGIFDGKGHVMSNFTAHLFPIPGLAGTGVIKNVAMVGYKITGSYGLIGVDMSGTMENCYFEGELTATNDTGAVASNGIGNAAVAKMKNVVVYAHGVSENHNEASIVAKKKSGYPASTFQNVIVATDLSNGHAYGTGDDVVEGVSGYASYVALRNAVTTIPEGFGEDWIMYNGVLIYKTTKSYYDALYNGTSMTVSNQATIEEGIHVEEPTTVVADKFFMTVTVTGLPATAYTVVGGTITLNETAVVGTNFTVTVTAMSKDGVKLYTKEISTKVAGKVVLVELEKQAVALNDENGLTVAVDGVASATDVSVMVDGVKSTVVPEVNANGFTFAKTAFTVTGYHEVQVQATVDGVIYKYGFTLGVFDQFISTATEFETLWKTTSATDTKAYALKNDINMSANAISWGDYMYAFTLDGLGHCVEGLKIANGLVYKSQDSFVLKNIAFIAYNKSTATYAFLGYQLKGKMDNVYVEGTQTGAEKEYPTNSTFNYLSGTVSNVVVNVHDRTFVNKFPVIGSLGGSVSNFYVVSNLYDGIGTTSKGIQVFDTLNAMKQVVTAVPEGFDTELWTIASDGKLTFKSLANRLTVNFAEMTDLGKVWTNKGSNCKIESTLTEDKYANQDVYAMLLNQDNKADKASQWYGSTDTTKQFAVAFKADKDCTMNMAGIKITANVWYILLIKDGKCYMGTENGYMSEVALGAYSSYPTSGLNNVMNFNYSDSVTIYSTNWFTK